MVISFKNANVLLIFYCLSINIFVVWISEYESNVDVHFNNHYQKLKILSQELLSSDANERNISV